MDPVVMWPFGKADVAAVVSGAVMAVTMSGNRKTHLTISQMAAAGTLNLTLGENKVGDSLIVRVSADGTNRALTPGTGMTGLAQTITANKSFLIEYEYDGSTFVHKVTTQLN